MSDENNEGLDQQALADEWAAALEEQTGESSDQADIDAMMDGMGGAAAPAPSTLEKASSADAKRVELDELTSDSGAAQVGKDPKLEVILDIPVRMTMEVGGTEIPIRNLLQLTQGSVIELDRVAGEPLDVKINGTLIAHGEVVVVNDRYGIRLTDVISPQERIRRLK